MKSAPVGVGVGVGIPAKSGAACQGQSKAIISALRIPHLIREPICVWGESRNERETGGMIHAKKA